jgi:hypothetical protein
MGKSKKRFKVDMKELDEFVSVPILETIPSIKRNLNISGRRGVVKQKLEIPSEIIETSS